MDKYRYKWLALVGICMLAFTAFLDFTIVNTALPFIQKFFDIDILQLQWVANIFPIILTMSMIAVGKIADALGRKKVFYFGIAIFGLSALCAGFSPSIEWLILFRGIQGLGASITFIASSALISDAFPENERTQAIGIYGGVTGAGLMLGPFFGGILIGLLDWRWVFWINIPIIVVGLIICLITLRGKIKTIENVHMDWKGLGFLIVGLGVSTYGIISGASSGFSLLDSGLIAIGAILIAFLIYFDLKASHPLLYLSAFKDKLLLLSVISCAVAGIVSYVFMFFDPLLLENVLKLSPYTIGLLVAIIPAAQVFISFTFKPIQKRLGLANLFLISILAPVIAAVLHFTFHADSSLWVFVIPFALLGINWGLSNTAMVTAVYQNAPENKTGEAIGTIATIWNFAGPIFLALSSVIYHLQMSGFLPAFHVVIGFNLAVMAVCILAALFIRLKIRSTSGR